MTEGNLEVSSTSIPLEVKPRDPGFVRLFIDGVEKNPGQFTVNLNKSAAIDANIIYTTTLGDTQFRAEVDHYTVPPIEVGDNATPNQKFFFKVENLKLLSGDYEVEVSTKGISKFKNINKNIEYFIALETA